MENSISTILVKIGTSLIGIGGLSTLIGSSTAETLALGDRGAAGLPWAATSAFGLPSVIKACVAAPIPSWLREALGLRSSATDSSVGMSFDLASEFRFFHALGRKMQIEAVGIACEGRARNTQISNLRERSVHVSSRDIYAFDRFTYFPLQHIPPSGVEDSLKFRKFEKDPYYEDPIVRWDLVCLTGSLTKMIEILVMCKVHAILLGVLSALPWIYFFICAVILHQQKLTRGYISDSRRVDIVAGQLPTPTKPGKDRKVILLAPKNFRLHFLWQAVWAIGISVSTSSLTGVYILLQQREPGITYIWLGFQVIWLLLRSIYFHISQDTAIHPILMEETVENMGQETRQRVLNLIFALAKFQILNHPRGSYCYKDDLLLTGLTQELFERILAKKEQNIKIDSLNECDEINVKAVMGDTVLSSACWIYSSKLTGLQLYDSCIVVIDIRNSTVAIPAARVLTSTGEHPGNDTAIKHPPRGGPNWGPDMVLWVYWIPCSDGRWLEVRSKHLRIIGKQKLIFVTDNDVTERFTSGFAKVDHTDVSGIKGAVDLSNSAAHILCEFVNVRKDRG
ncbi:hypothetical protein PENFLA_c043G03666 [Penicillium flavigenum]|uniref:Uncharacterized protein n=1 Tax=Penicillium flavigenum TaxID=254877 RepID=A0A1V6SIQ0_9EURO|nr:hypothetical protein PENFLA_c043G03666 [Penicillium flavigenum]